MSNLNYFESIGVSDESEAFYLVRDYCFLQNQTPSNEQVKTMLAVCIANNFNPRMGEIYDEYYEGDFDCSGIVVPTLRIRGWYRLADSSGRVKGVEFVYADTEITNEQGALVVTWIECQVWLDDNERPITARVYAAERALLGGAWLTMPNQRLEQSAYTSAISRALGVRGVSDTDTTALCKMNSLGKDKVTQTAPGAATTPLIEDTVQDENPPLTLVEETPEVLTEATGQTEETEVNQESVVSEEWFADFYDSFNEGSRESSVIIEQEQEIESAQEPILTEPEKAAKPAMEQATAVIHDGSVEAAYRATQHDRRLLQNIAASATQNNTWVASIDYVKTQPYPDALKIWLVEGLQAAASKAGVEL